MVDCHSANFFRKLSFCELMSDLVAETGVLDVAPGYMFYVKPSSDDVCTVRKCQIGTTCGQNSNCQVTYCAHALNVDNGVVYGNMSDIGAQRVIECLPNYKLVLGYNITTCTDSGVWGNTSAILCEMVCPLPERSLDGGFVASSNIVTVTGVQTFSGNDLFDALDIDILDSSTVVYQCDSNRKMVGTNTVTCNSRLWASYPSCIFTFGSTCSNDQDCSEPGLVCSSGKCQCNGKQIYTYGGHQCVDRCPGGLAGSFHTVTDVTVYTTNYDSSFEWVFSSCQNNCLSNSNCKGFLHTAGICYLYWSYAVDVTIGWGVGHYHRRDCK
ncbi:calcium ion binding [Mactra antiquata]